MTTFPDFVVELPQLSKLRVWANAFSSIPAEIGNLTGLTELDFSGGSRLTELPESIGELVKLKSLNLRGNLLCTLPDSIANLQALKELDLAQNRFSSVPNCLATLKNLEVLRMQVNRLTTLPRFLAALTKLRTLRVESNPLLPPLDVLNDREVSASEVRAQIAKHLPTNRTN